MKYLLYCLTIEGRIHPYFLDQMVVASRGAAAEAAKSEDKAAWGLRSEKKKTFAIYRLQFVCVLVQTFTIFKELIATFFHSWLLCFA